MKLVKKVLAGALSLAIVLGAMFAFTGCNSVQNETYAFESMTVTVVKAVDEDGKITETQTLTLREYFIFEIVGELDQIAGYTLSEDEEKAFTEMQKTFTGGAPKAVFYKDEVHMITEEKNEYTGEIKRDVNIAEYTVDKNIITIVEKVSENEMKNDIDYKVYTLEIVDGKIHQKAYEMGVAGDDNFDGVYAKNDIVCWTAIFAKVK